MGTHKLFAAAAALAIGFAGAATAQEKTLTVVSWGGAYTTSQIEAYHKPFAAKTGMKLLSQDYNGGLAEVTTQVKAGKVTWDIVDVELADAVKGCDEGLFMKLDVNTLPKGDDGTAAKDDFIQGTVSDCAVATILWSTIYAYDSTKFPGAKPATIADFFDTAKFPGKRGMRKSPKINLEFALMSTGVAAKDVYKEMKKPGAIDKAFAILDKIKKDVVWWEAGAQPPQLLADGAVVMTTAYNGRIYGAVKADKKPFVIVWDGQVWDLDLWSIPKGTPNVQAALDFLKFSTDTQRLADQTKWISYGPARKSSLSKIAADVLPHMPTHPDNMKNSVQNDYLFWADQSEELGRKFQAWLAK